MGCYGDAAKGAFDALFPLEIGHTHFLDAFENVCRQIISSRTGDRTHSMKCSFSPHFSKKLGEKERSEVSREGGSAVPSSPQVRRFQLCLLSPALFQSHLGSRRCEGEF